MNNPAVGDKDHPSSESLSDQSAPLDSVAEGALLRHVLELLSPCLDEDELFARLPQVVDAWVPHDAGLVARYTDGGTPHLHINSQHGLSAAAFADRFPARDLLDPWDVTVPVRIDDLAGASERVAGAFARHELRSLLIVPLGAGGEPQLILVLAARQPGAFAALPDTAIDRFRELVAAPLRNAARFGQAQRAGDETLHLAETLYTQLGAATGDVLMQKLLRLARDVTRADAGSLMVVLPDSAGLYVRVAQGIPPHIPVPAQLPWGDHALDALAAMSAPLRLDNLAGNPVEPFGTFARAHGFGSYLGVPVRRGGHLLGLLNFYNQGAQAPRADDGRRVALVAQAMGQALEQDRLRAADRLHLALRTQFHQHKEELFELLAHQLRTPLTSIKGFAQLLLRRSQSSGNENMAKYLETVLHEANRLSVLVTNALELSQLEKALIDTRSHPLDLRAVLLGFQRRPDVIRLAEERRLEWDLPTAPVLIQGDAPGLVTGLFALLQRVDAEAPPGHSLTLALTATADRSQGGTYPVMLRIEGGEPATSAPNVTDLLRHLDLRTISDSASSQWSDLALYTALQLFQAQGADLAFYITAAGTLAYEVRFASPEAH
jgi:GAF domain-containing protein